MTPREKADRAKQLLGDPMLRHVLADIREGFVAGLEGSNMDDRDTHHEVALALQILKRIPDQLRKYAADIEIEKHRQQQDSFMERIRQKLTP